MKRGVSLSALFALVFVSIGSLGVTDCSEDFRLRLANVVIDHGERLDALERCDCEGVLAPVCGENGKTYVNRCEARCARTEIAYRGRCKQPECGGPDAIACGENQFCETRPSCEPDAAGVCEEIPDACTDEYAPVCGCDGITYSNDCERRAAGAGIAFRGACEDTPSHCGTNDDCSDTDYCRKRDGVCEAHGGVCTPRPGACTLQYDPVCGCDGETYSNACAAAGAGASVQYDGPCDPVPLACKDNSECDSSEFCQKHAGQCRDEGACAARQEVCPLFTAPVCGCDGNTYDNACAASAAGASIASDGACQPVKVPVCHIPPGNPANRHTIFVGASAVPAHLGHGDHRGDCDEPSR